MSRDNNNNNAGFPGIINPSNQKPPMFINFLYFGGFVNNKIGFFGSVPLAQARLMLVASHFPLPSPPEAWAAMWQTHNSSKRTI